MEYERAEPQPSGLNGKWVVAVLLAIIFSSITAFLCVVYPIFWRF